MSYFEATPYTPPDAMFELKAEYDRDPSPDKITLGPGAYQDDNGQPWILPSVRMAEDLMRKNPPGHEYLPILGLPAFRKASSEIIFGRQSQLLKDKRVATIQTISGTGAIHIAAAYLQQFHPKAKVYVSNPSWSNHRVMFEYQGFDVEDYPYYDPATKGVDFDGFRVSMESAEPGSIYILHACAHNPTGCDLSREQWEIVGKVIKDRKLVPLLDSAYQGFASGDLDRDAWAVRYILEEVGVPGIVCQSFSKNMGLYGERAGALHITVGPNAESSVIRNIESQIGWISRKEISNANRYGATIAATIITSPSLYEQWCEDMREMSGRIQSMRRAVVEGLEKRGTPGMWTHVVDQIGMFSYTGISRDRVMRLRTKHIYMAENGRASIAGLNKGNIEYFCNSVDEVMRE